MSKEFKKEERQNLNRMEGGRVLLVVENQSEKGIGVVKSTVD